MGPDQRPVDESPVPRGPLAAPTVHSAADAGPPNKPVQVIHGLHDNTAQTPGMHRKVAVDKESTGSEKLWFGRVTCPPGMNSGPHHHAEAETAGHMLSGDRIRIYFGNNYEEYVEIKTGDYLFVPAYVPHIEVNMSETLPAEFVTARSPTNIVVNLDDEDGVGPGRPGAHGS
jgi:uncharacterized RmlC-like cupin family protein